MFYLDDGTLGGCLDDVLHDLQSVELAAGEMGLATQPWQVRSHLRGSYHYREAMLCAAPGLRVVSRDHATLLGSPIGSVEGIDEISCAKTKILQVMGDRLRHLHAHDAYCLLRHSFSIPKVLYTLRTTPCFLSSRLGDFDNLQRLILGDITNIRLNDDDLAWAQASLPVGAGGLGIRSAVQLAPSAFLASAAGSSDLIHQILPPQMRSLPYPAVSDALDSWSHAGPLLAEQNKRKIFPPGGQPPLCPHCDRDFGGDGP